MHAEVLKKKRNTRVELIRRNIFKPDKKASKSVSKKQGSEKRKKN